MIIYPSVKGKTDKRATIIKNDRDQIPNVAIGDILLTKINETVLVSKILEDFTIISYQN